DQDGAVDDAARQPGQGAALPAHPGTPVAARPGQQLVLGALHRVRGTLEQLGRERLELGDQDAEHVRPVAAQALRPQARLVPELVNDLAYAVDGRLCNAVAAVDD